MYAFNYVSVSVSVSLYFEQFASENFVLSLFCSFLLGWRTVSHSKVLYYDTPLKWILCAVPFKAAKAIEIRQIRQNPELALAGRECSLEPQSLGIKLCWPNICIEISIFRTPRVMDKPSRNCAFYTFIFTICLCSVHGILEFLSSPRQLK